MKSNYITTSPQVGDIVLDLKGRNKRSLVLAKVDEMFWRIRHLDFPEGNPAGVFLAAQDELYKL